MSPQPSGLLEKFLETAGSISSSWSLAAFSIAAILALLYAQKSTSRGNRHLMVVGIVGIVILGLIPIITRAWSESAHGVYRLRAIVLDQFGVPVDTAAVWSDVGGEWKRGDGAWEITIPRSTLPASRVVVVRAARRDAFETAVDSLLLGEDYNPKLTLRLTSDRSASIRGVVVDARDRGLAGVSVWVVGYGTEKAITDSIGNFVLMAHAADGQHVLLRAERGDLGSVESHHPAGSTPAKLTIAKQKDQ
jgi:hypothetical protein